MYPHGKLVIHFSVSISFCVFSSDNKIWLQLTKHDFKTILSCCTCNSRVYWTRTLAKLQSQFANLKIHYTHEHCKLISTRWVEASNTPPRCGGSSWLLGNLSTATSCSAVPWGNLQIRIRFVRQRGCLWHPLLPLKQTNKYQHGFHMHMPTFNHTLQLASCTL